MYYCKEEGIGLCNKCKIETHHATTHHLHLVNDLSKWVIEQFITKIDQTDEIRKILKSRENELEVPERSFIFGLEMINHEKINQGHPENNDLGSVGPLGALGGH